MGADISKHGGSAYIYPTSSGVPSVKYEADIDTSKHGGESATPVRAVNGK